MLCTQSRLVRRKEGSGHHPSYPILKSDLGHPMENLLNLVPEELKIVFLVGVRCRDSSQLGSL